MPFYVPKPKSKGVNSFGEGNKNRLEMYLELVPDPDYAPNQVYNVTGLGSNLFNGAYRLDKVRHTVSSDGYRTTADGVRIKLPTTSGTGGSSATKKKKEIVHTVRAGDNLWNILKKYNRNPMKYPAVAKYNHIRNPHLIFPNQTIRIPPHI